MRTCVFCWGALCLVLFLIRSSYSSSNEIFADDRLNERKSRILGIISKPPTDRREYRGIVLANDMKVILVSDPNTTKAAASLCVAAGSMSEPKEIPGLAHFLEHMLFLGNQKYPEENEFQKFVSEHGGASNAVTQTDETYYFFGIAPEFLKDALDRFAQFFISPLFTESALEREVNAVNSEHEKNVPDDKRRQERVESLTLKDGHPYTQFRTGTRETLWKRPKENNIDVRAALLDFFQKFYSANLMTLAVLGSESLDELQTIVESVFLGIPNANTTIETWPESPYGPDEILERIDIVPVGDVKSLMLVFPVPEIKQYFKTSAVGYISHLLGQEGPGSLPSLLKAKHWADYILVGPDVMSRGFSNIKIKITLTQEGLENMNTVIMHVFEYVKMIRKLGPQKWFWEEVRDINSLHFRFRDENYPVELVRKLCVFLIQFPIEEIFRAGGVPSNPIYDEENIKETMSYLTPRNFRMVVVSKEFSNLTDTTEEYYGVQYGRRKIPMELIEAWENAGENPLFHMPLKNEFIPTEFELKPRDEMQQDNDNPRILKDTAEAQVWFLQDQEFRLPKAYVSLEILNPIVYADPERENMAYIFRKLILESISEFHYSGSLAGLQSYVMGATTGIHVIVKGYDHKLALFAHEIIEKILSFSTTRKKFETVKETRLSLLRNFRDHQPCEHAEELLKTVLLEKRWTTAELIDSITNLTMESFTTFVKQFLSHVKLRWFFYGNLTPEEALRVADDCQQIFAAHESKPLVPGLLGLQRTVKLPLGISHTVKAAHESHSSSCTTVFFQVGVDNIRRNILGSLVTRMAFHMFYDQLRTKEQLGYVVVSDIYHGDFLTTGLWFYVQGNQHPAFVELRINSALDDFYNELKNMTQETFERHKRSLIQSKSTKPKTMDERAMIANREIRSENLIFNRQDLTLATIGTVTLDEVVQFFEDNLMDSMRKRRKLVIHVVSTSLDNITEPLPSTRNNDEITNIHMWKRQQELYPSKISHS